MAVDVLLVYDSIVCNEKQRYSKESNEALSDSSEKSFGSATGSPTFHSLILKLPEEVQTKLTQSGRSTEASSSDIDMAVLKSVLYEVLLE
jgi:hypothetical protein